MAVGVASSPALAAGDPLLEKMAGDWIGRGTFKASPTAESELVYCKITNTLASGGNTLTQKGRCAVATNSGRVSGKFESKGGGAYSGSLESLATRGPATITGTAQGSNITFQAKFVDRKTKKSGTATIQMAIGDGKYRLVSNGIDASGNQFVASDINFTKQ